MPQGGAPVPPPPVHLGPTTSSSPAWHPLWNNPLGANPLMNPLMTLPLLQSNVSGQMNSLMDPFGFASYSWSMTTPTANRNRPMEQQQQQQQPPNGGQQAPVNSINFDDFPEGSFFSNVANFFSHIQ